VIKPGFKYNRGKDTKSVAEESRLLSLIVVIPSGFHYNIRLELSKEATFHILD
jgi:hypothetical protein